MLFVVGQECPDSCRGHLGCRGQIRDAEPQGFYSGSHVAEQPTHSDAGPTDRRNSSSCEYLDLHFAINARAVALMMAEYVKRYLARGATWGRILNTSTDAAHAHPANVSYAASKHAIESYSSSAADELGKYSIAVNIVAPGPVQSGYITPESEREIERGTPLGRVGRPEDVAGVMVFLASHQARWMTGQLLYVGGGWRMGL